MECWHCTATFGTAMAGAWSAQSARLIAARLPALLFLRTRCQRRCASTVAGVAGEIRCPLSVGEVGALVGQLHGRAPIRDVGSTNLSATVGVSGQVARQLEEHAALLKRSWSDEPFEAGEAGNDLKVQGFELELVDMLLKSRRGLADGVILGNAIDLAGAYKKNYKLDKAEAVLLRCTRQVEDRREGAWMAKYLNHLSQVRMKQARNVEALEMMFEIESLAAFSLDEPGASGFYETLYRNMSCGLRSAGREDEAAIYFLRMAEAARRHKPALDWMDRWELGVLMANRAFQEQRWTEFYTARDIIAEALAMQRAAEPRDLVMRAKVLSNLGQCYLATGEHEEAEKHYAEAYELFDGTVGKRSPLFGMQAWACANLRLAEGAHLAALPLLGEALYVEVVGDGLSVSEMLKLVDLVLRSFHECSAEGSDSAHTEPIRRSLNTLIEDPRWDLLEGTLELGVLAHKMALVYLAARWLDKASITVARRYNSRAMTILSRYDSREARQWTQWAEAIHRAALAPARAASGDTPLGYNVAMRAERSEMASVAEDQIGVTAPLRPKTPIP